MMKKNAIERASRQNDMYIYVDKILNVLCRHVDTYNDRSARPYYPLDDGWALTFLTTGQPFFVNTADRNITPWIIMGGHWETNVDRVIMQYVQSGMAVADVGANMGYYTVKMGAKIGSAGRLWAFEPNPEVSGHCLENIKLNNLTGVAVLHEWALGDQPGTATLTRSKSNMASANLVGDQSPDYAIEVMIQTLDVAIGLEQQLDFIKIDAEGYEPKILQGARNILNRSPSCALMIELSLERWQRFAPLNEFLPLCGGTAKRLFAVTDVGRLTWFDEGNLESYLLTRPYHENYFLVGSEELIHRYCADLIEG